MATNPEGEPEQSCTIGELRPRVVLAVLVAGTILAPLDSSIVNIALPSIAAEFGESLSAVSWVTTAYLLTTASLLLSMGRLGDMWGLKQLYAAGLLVFAIGSASSALSPSLSVLIASRVLQAVGASMLFAAGPALVTRTFPSGRRGWALGYIALSVSLGLTLGPALGGLLVGTFGWPSIFIINIPLALIVAAVAWRMLPAECPEPQRFDIPGALLVGTALLLMLLGLSRGDRAGLFSVEVFVPVGASLLLLGLFTWWESRTPHPMVDPRLFESRPFNAGVGAATLAYMALFAVTFTLPFYLLRVLGIDARLAGLVLTATPIAMAVLAPVAGRASDRMGSRALATGGTLGLATGLALGSFLNASSTLWHVIVVLLFVGGGMAVFQTPNTSAILRATPRWSTGVGSAFVSLARNVGMAIGIALTAAILGASLGGAGLPSGEGAVSSEVAAAFNEGMSRAMRTGAGIAVLAAAISWFGRTSDAVEPQESTH